LEEDEVLSAVAVAAALVVDPMIGALGGGEWGVIALRNRGGAAS